MHADRRDNSAARQAVRQALWRRTWERLLAEDSCSHSAREWHPAGQNAAAFLCRDCGLIVELGGNNKEPPHPVPPKEYGAAADEHTNGGGSLPS